MSIYRNVVWYLKGKKEYMKAGFEAASKKFNPSDLDVDVKGRSFMVTGANSGLGLTCALEIAKRGGTLHMVCRNQERGEKARNDIIGQTSNQDVHLHIVDMGVPRQVVAFAKQFCDTGNSLNVLVNNAGCMLHTRVHDADGLEANFATNTLGTHLLTVSLIPVLSKSDKPRVIIVSSGGMLTQKLDVSDLQCNNNNFTDGTMIYAQNKRQQVIMTEEYAKKYSNIHFSSMHPGWADTKAVQEAMPDFYQSIKLSLRTPEQGADSLVWLAVAKCIDSLPSGQFFQDRQVVSKHLPLAWTKSSRSDIDKFMAILDEFTQKYMSE